MLHKNTTEAAAAAEVTGGLSGQEQKPAHEIYFDEVNKIGNERGEKMGVAEAQAALNATREAMKAREALVPRVNELGRISKETDEYKSVKAAYDQIIDDALSEDVRGRLGPVVGDNPNSAFHLLQEQERINRTALEQAQKREQGT